MLLPHSDKAIFAWTCGREIKSSTAPEQLDKLQTAEEDHVI